MQGYRKTPDQQWKGQNVGDFQQHIQRPGPGPAGQVNQNSRYDGGQYINSPSPIPTGPIGPRSPSQNSDSRHLHQSPEINSPEDPGLIKMHPVSRRDRQPRINFENTRLAYHKRDLLFEDREFPARDTSVYFSRRPPFEITWLRPWEICRRYNSRVTPELFTEGASRFDIKQGQLGDCWVVASLACMSEHRELLYRVIPSGQSFRKDWYAGMFRFQFYYNGEWEEVVIDDRLPTRKGGLIFIHSTVPNEFWGALVEKAYAKLHGSFEALKSGYVADALIGLTGGIVESYTLNSNLSPVPKDIVPILFKAIERQSLIGCGIDPVEGITEARLQSGLVAGHAYSVTDIKEIRLMSDRGEMSYTLLRVRNPWGTHVEWNGAWSDKSREWNSISPHDREALGLKFRDDGEFWIEFQDFLRNIHTLDICNLTPDSLKETRRSWKVQYFHGRWRRGINAGGRPRSKIHWTNPQFKVTLRDTDDADSKCSFVVELTQKDRRALRHKDKQNLSIGFFLYKVSRDTTVPLPKRYFDRYHYVEGVNYFTNTTQVTKRFSMVPGVYVIIPCTYDSNEEAEFVVRICFEQDNSFEPAPDPDEREDPIPADPEPEPPARDQEAEFKKFFYNAAGQDMEVDVFEFRKVVNIGLKNEPDHKDLVLGLVACRALLRMVDIDDTGKLNYFEFTFIWNMLRSWKKLFYSNDKNKSHTIDTYELREALEAQGYRINTRVMSKIAARFANEEMVIEFDNFLVCMCKIWLLFKIYKKHESERGNAVFTRQQFIESALVL